MKSHFLQAKWNNLVLANYPVPEEILLPYLPFGTEPDHFEGQSYVSLVGLMFFNTRIMGLGFPFHRNFEEVNLRFYVRSRQGQGWKKGVVFIKEIVPRRAVSFLANTLYGENYATMKMRHFHRDEGQNFATGYEWYSKNKWNKISAVSGGLPRTMTVDSRESFFADHYWGFSKGTATKTFTYGVEHRRWETLEVISYDVDCDFGSLYGNQFSFLNKTEPKSVLVTRGSEVKVLHKRVWGPSFPG